jgi:hypothetical protein
MPAVAPAANVEFVGAGCEWCSELYETACAQFARAGDRVRSTTSFARACSSAVALRRSTSRYRWATGASKA